MKMEDYFLLEAYGTNDIVIELTNYVINIINKNIGKLILNKRTSIKNSLKDFNKIKFNNDLINIKISNRFYGNINPKSIVIDDSMIIHNFILNLEIVLTKEEICSKQLNIRNEIKDIINHEFLHIIELYFTKLNKNTISKSWENGKRLQYLQKKYKSKIWEEISHIIYISLPHEIRARISTVGENIDKINIKGIKNVHDFIKTTKIYKDSLSLTKLDPVLVLNRLKTDVNYLNIISDFNLIFLENDKIYPKEQEIEFIKYFNKIIYLNKKMIKKLIKLSYKYESLDIEDFGYPIEKYIDYSKYQ